MGGLECATTRNTRTKLFAGYTNARRYPNTDGHATRAPSTCLLVRHHRRRGKLRVELPKGSRLDCVAHFDNSPNNKYNPDPAKEVRWGDQTWEEMMIGWFDFTLDSQNLLSKL